VIAGRALGAALSTAVARSFATIPRVHVHPAPAPDDVSDAWTAAVDDAGINIGDVALIWRGGRPRATGQEAASWRAGTDIHPEFDDDYEFIEALKWANRVPIRGLPRVMVWVKRTPEGLAGLLRHELEHTIQIAAHVELDLLHQRAVDVLRNRGGTGKSYNAIPMEVDANRAAARFLRRRYGAARLRHLVAVGDADASCFRPTADPEGLDTLVDRMSDFILTVIRDDDFVRQLEALPTAE
jgi:hypothetical protein